MDWISVTPRSPDAETIGKARAMEKFLNSERGRKALADATPAPKSCDGLGVLPCGCSALMVAAAGHYSMCPAMNKALLEIVDEGIAADPKPYYDYSAVAPKPSAAPGIDPRALAHMEHAQRVFDRGMGVNLPVDEREIARLQADADNHSGKPFTVGPGLALRETVRGCRRCRIRRFHSACEGCGDLVTSFELEPGRTGW